MSTSKVAAPRARHAIDVVEAAYSLEGSDAEWLSRVLDAAHADLDCGRGSYGFTCRIGGKGLEMGPVYLERELDRGFGAFVEKLNREVPEAVNELLRRSACICGGIVETLGTTHDGTRHVRGAVAKSGIVDCFSLFAQDGEGFGIDLSCPSSVHVETSPRVRGIWRRTSVHLAAGMRLRRRLGEGTADVDAVLSADGRLAHATGEVSESADARRRLISAATSIDRARTTKERREPERALELWRGLVMGEWSLVDRWESDGKRFIAAYRNRPRASDPRALTRLERSVLGYATLGASNKEIAFALGLSISTIGSATSALLRKLGCRRRSDLLAFSEPVDADRVSVPLGDRDELSLLVARAPRNADRLALLTLAEREIAHLVLDGASNEHIARVRGTSQHTVANQLRAMYRKLSVQSRSAMVRALTTA